MKKKKSHFKSTHTKKMDIVQKKEQEQNTVYRKFAHIELIRIIVRTIIFSSQSKVTFYECKWKVGIFF